MTPCTICFGNPERKAFVNAELVAHTPHTTIEQKAKVLGLNVKRETIRRHVKTCIPAAVAQVENAGTLLVQHRWANRDKPKQVPVAAPVVVRVPTPLTNLPDSDDMATLVRAAAVEKLKAGELRITTQDGLAAQSLLDRREEKKKDRELITQLGILLSRGSVDPPLIDVTPSSSSEAFEPLLLEE